MILSGCSGNSGKPSEPSSQMTSSEIVSSITASKTTPSYKVNMGENALSCVVEPKKITDYISFEYIGRDDANNRNYRLTLKSPADITARSNEYNLELGQMLTYTESSNLLCRLKVEPAQENTMDLLLNGAKKIYEESNKQRYYKVYDDGILERMSETIDWMVETTRYFDCGYILIASFPHKEGLEETIYDIVSSAELTITKKDTADIVQTSGPKPEKGTPSDKYNEYCFTCNDFAYNEEYNVAFEIPEGMGYDVNRFAKPEDSSGATNTICSVCLTDYTGYSAQGVTTVYSKIDFIESAKYDLSDSSKYEKIDDDIYMYEYFAAFYHKVYFRIIDEKYIVYIDETQDNLTEMDELEKKIAFEYFKSVRVSKK